MSGWHTEWEFKGEYLNVSKLTQIGAADAPESEVRLFCFRHLAVSDVKKPETAWARVADPALTLLRITHVYRHVATRSP